MNGYLVAMFYFTMLLALGYLPFRLYVTQPAFRMRQKYKLFAVRDKLIYLKINGDFIGHDALYERYIDRCTKLIAHTQELNLPLMLRLIDSITAEDEVAAEELNQRIKAAPECVRAVIASYYSALVDILVENSTLLRFLLMLRASSRCLSHVGGAGKLLGSDKLRLVEEYDDVSNLYRSLPLQPA